MRNFAQDCPIVELLAARRKLERATLRPRLWAGHDKDFHIRRWANDGADVASVENRSARPGRKATLRRDQRLAHGRHGGDDRGRLGHVAPAQQRLVEIGQRQAARRRNRRIDVM